MRAKEYAAAVARAGGVNAVARLLGCGRDRILKRTNGRQAVGKSDELAVLALPEAEDWELRSKLVRDAGWRRTFAKRLADVDEWSRERGERLLAQTFCAFRATQGGRKKWKNKAKDGGKAKK